MVGRTGLKPDPRGSLMASAQDEERHELINVTDGRSGYERTTHPDAQWLPGARPRPGRPYTGQTSRWLSSVSASARFFALKFEDVTTIDDVIEVRW